MKKRFFLCGMVWIVSLWCGTVPLHAQEDGPIFIQEMYHQIFEDFRHPEVKLDLISLFEKNFTELIHDIENNATPEEGKQIIQFLKIEFNHYADAWPLKDKDPEAFNSFLVLKRKDYKTMVLGNKIQRIARKRGRQQDLETYQKELRALLAEVLAAKLDKEQEDIDGLENRLKNLKEMHEIRKKNKDKILQNRYDELIGNHDIYRW